MTKPPKSERDKYLTDDEFYALLKASCGLPLAFKIPGEDQRCSMAIYLGGMLGLRIGEIVRFRREHFKDLNKNIVHVPTLKRRKKSKSRVDNSLPLLPVAVNDETVEVIRDYLKLLPDLPGKDLETGEEKKVKQHWLFRSYKSPYIPVSDRTITRWFKAAVNRAKLNPNYTYHNLRHFRGYTLWKETKDMMIVKIQLRHKDMQSTQIYTHMTQEDIVAKIRSF